MGFIGLFNPGKKAAKIQAAATIKSAEMVANNDRLVAQGAAQSLETQINQKIAADKAAEILSKPQGQIDVQLAPDTPDAVIDPTTGRRKTVRSTFQSKSTSGIRI